MNAVFAVVLKTLKTMLLALLGEKIIAKLAFSFLEYLASLSETNIDDDIVKDWQDAYYGKPKESS